MLFKLHKTIGLLRQGISSRVSFRGGGGGGAPGGGGGPPGGVEKVFLNGAGCEGGESE